MQFSNQANFKSVHLWLIKNEQNSYKKSIIFSNENRSTDAVYYADDCTTHDLEIKIKLETKSQELYFKFKVLGGAVT